MVTSLPVPRAFDHRKLIVFLFVFAGSAILLLRVVNGDPLANLVCKTDSSSKSNRYLLLFIAPCSAMIKSV